MNLSWNWKALIPSERVISWKIFFLYFSPLFSFIFSPSLSEKMMVWILQTTKWNPPSPPYNLQASLEYYLNLLCGVVSICPFYLRLCVTIFCYKKKKKVKSCSNGLLKLVKWIGFVDKSSRSELLTFLSPLLDCTTLCNFMWK